MKVAVLGCGPAGLMAAHAVHRAASEVHIYSKKVRSPMGGAQYLHKPIPDITGSKGQGTITYCKVGTAACYAEKVYGDRTMKTSWELFEGVVRAWSLAEAYGKLCMRYWNLVEDRELYPQDVPELCEAYDLVVSTIPASLLCERRDEHSFLGQGVVLVPKAKVQVNNLVLYNGRPANQDPWYRTSRIFDEGWTEYSIDHAPKSYGVQPGAVRGIKPLRHTCTCHDSRLNFVRQGRFGRWEKGVLTHDAYVGTAKAMADRARVLEAH